MINTGETKDSDDLNDSEMIACTLVQSLFTYLHKNKDRTTIRRVYLVSDFDDHILEWISAIGKFIWRPPETASYIEPPKAKRQWYWKEDGNVWMPYDYDQNIQIDREFDLWSVNRSHKMGHLDIIGDLHGRRSRSRNGHM